MSPNIARFPWGGVKKTTKSLKTTVLQSYFKDQKLFPKKENELHWYFKTAGVEEKFSLEVLDPGPDAVTFHLILKTLQDKSLTSTLKTMKLNQRGNYLPKVTKLHSELTFKSKPSLPSLAPTTAWTQILEDIWCVFSYAPAEAVRPTQLSLSFKKNVGVERVCGQQTVKTG